MTFFITSHSFFAGNILSGLCKRFIYFKLLKSFAAWALFFISEIFLLLKLAVARVAAIFDL